MSITEHIEKGVVMKSPRGSNAARKTGFILKLSTLIVSFSLIALSLGLAGCAPKPAPVPTVEVIDVVNMTKDDATRVIATVGFKLGAVSEDYSETVAAGNVISQSPEPGKQVDSGSTITLVVSKGSNAPPEKVTVPNLSGMTQTQAEDALLAIKLMPLPGNPEFAPGVDPGKIFKQSVNPGTSVEVGTTIRFVVALGSETVTVPKVAGQSRDAAVGALVAAGLGVDVHEEYNATVAAGLVITTNPYGGVVCVKGTTVFVTVSAGPVPVGTVKVPDLSTLTLSQAIGICNSAGLVLDPTGSDLNGTVVKQDPAPGTMVEPGKRIIAQFEPVDLVAVP